MATTRKTATKSAPADNATTVDETPEVVDEVEIEPTPLEVEMSELPGWLEEGTIEHMLAKEIANGMARIAENERIILENSLTNEAITHCAETSDNEGIVTARKEVQNIEETIAELQAKVEKAREELGRKVESLNGKARELLSENISTDAKDGAKAEKDAAARQISTYLTSFKTAVPNWKDHDVALTWVGRVNSKANGARAVPASTSGNSNPSKDPRRIAYNNDVRAWAKNNGRDISPKGRIPDKVYVDYMTETGNVFHPA